MNLQALLGNFALILFILTLATGVVWFVDVFYLARQRRARADAALAEYDARNARLAADGVPQDTNARSAIAARMLRQPTWVEYSGSFFPVILLVFVLRSFLFEPFKIPSGSMIPTLLVGDLILVNKFTYGLRLPVANTKLTEGTPPQRGDVMVFRYPPKPSLDYIKRVVGVPGDEVAYLNKKLTINGQSVEKTPMPDFFDEDAMRYGKQFEEMLGGKRHKLLNDDDRPAFVPGAEDFPFKQNCRYSVEGVTCKVPQGHYFMMGDNRDNSLDSRYWGFVPDRNIVGKAFFIWMNFGNLKRFGSFE